MSDGKYIDGVHFKIHHIQDPVISISVSINAHESAREGLAEIDGVPGKIGLDPRNDFPRSWFVRHRQVVRYLIVPNNLPGSIRVQGVPSDPPY